MPMGAPANVPEPKSAWRPTLLPMKPVMVPELASTAAVEMSWFHGLPAGNGRKPLRLASSPTAKPLQFVMAPETAVIAAAADFDVSAALVADKVYEPAADGAV